MAPRTWNAGGSLRGEGLTVAGGRAPSQVESVGPPAFPGEFQVRGARDAHIATWYNYLGIAAFVVGQDEKAAEWARMTMEANPQFPGGYRTLAGSSGNLEQLTEAEAAREKLQELLPHLTVAQLRESLPYFKNPDDLERYLDGLRKAGLPE